MKIQENWEILSKTRSIYSKGLKLKTWRNHHFWGTPCRMTYSVNGNQHMENSIRFLHLRFEYFPHCPDNVCRYYLIKIKCFFNKTWYDINRNLEKETWQRQRKWNKIKIKMVIEEILDSTYLNFSFCETETKYIMGLSISIRLMSKSS